LQQLGGGLRAPKVCNGLHHSMGMSAAGAAAASAPAASGPHPRTRASSGLSASRSCAEVGRRPAGQPSSTAASASAAFRPCVRGGGLRGMEAARWHGGHKVPDRPCESTADQSGARARIPATQDRRALHCVHTPWE
jgi:hypothetical protein